MKWKQWKLYLKSLVLIGLIAALLFVSVPFASAEPAENSGGQETTTAPGDGSGEEGEEEEDDKSEQIQKEIEEVQKKLDELKGKTDKIEDYQIQLELKVRLLYAQIEEFNLEIAPLEQSILDGETRVEELETQTADFQEKIGTIEAEMAVIQQELDVCYGFFCQRMKASYMSGSLTTLEVLLSSKDFSTLLTRIQMLWKIAKVDSENLQEVQGLMQKSQAKLDAMQEDVDALREMTQELTDLLELIDLQKKLVDEKQSALTRQQGELQNTLQESGGNLEKLYAQNLSYLSEMQKLKAIDNALKGLDPDELDGVDDYTVKGFIWPVPSCKSISCGFYGYSGHNGIDIPGNYGTDIVAAAGGKVVVVQRLSGSYGNYCIIYHGGGIYSLYAHCSLLKVSVGQTVSQGQVIAKVGNSGNVLPRPTSQYPYAGTHLHFGMKVNDTWINPLKYVPQT